MSLAITTYALTKRFPVQAGWRRTLKRGPTQPPAVDAVNLKVEAGELFGLVGPNGAGKTTLIKLLATLIQPTSGAAYVNGHALADQQAIKSSIGLVTNDERSFYWRLTGRQNLAFFATLHGLSSDKISKRVNTALEQMGLETVADHRFQTYSTGMRQRLSIARSLLNQPQLLFLDEPTKGLDPTATRQLHNLIRTGLSETQGLTVFLTTHLLPEAESLCDRIAIIHHGKIRACGTLAELQSTLEMGERYHLQISHSSPELLLNLEKINPALRLSQHPNGDTELAFDVLPDPQTLNQVLDVIRESGGGIQGLNRTTVSLDEIFVRLTDPGETGHLPTAQGLEVSPFENQPAGVAAQPPAASSLRTSYTGLKHGLRVARAFLQRDLQSEVSYRISFVFQFFSVFFSVAVFYFVAQLLGEAAAPLLAPYGGDYFSFVLIGIAFAGYFGVGLSSFSNSLRQAQTTGTLEAMLTTPTGVSTIILSSSLWNYLLTTLRVLVYLGVGVIFLGVNLRGGNYFAALLVLLFTILAFSSLGIIAASFIMVLKRGDPITLMLGAFSSLLGGVYYPIEVLPDWMQGVARFIPVTYALRAMRLALLQGFSTADLLPDLLALASFGLVLLPLSLLAFRFAVQRARVDGSLTHY